MFKKHFTLLLFLLSYSLMAQSNFVLQGEVNYQENVPTNIYVVNKTQDKTVQINAKNTFEIDVKIGDEMVIFDAHEYFESQIFYIVAADEHQPRQIELIPKADELAEIIIEANPTAESLGITPDVYQKPNPTQADIKGLLLMFVGLFVSKKAPEPPNFSQRKTWFENQFSVETLTDKYNIPTEKADLFYRYLANDSTLINILQSNPKQTEIELHEKSFRFLHEENNQHEE